MICKKNFFDSSSVFHTGNVMRTVNMAFRKANLEEKGVSSSPLSQVYSDIIKGLKNQQLFIFQYDSDLVADRKAYEKSIQDLYNKILEYSQIAIKKRNAQNPNTEIEEFRNLLNSDFKASTGLLDINIQLAENTDAVIEGTELISEQERLSRKLKSILDSYYGYVPMAQTVREVDFNNAIMKATRINTDTKEMVTNSQDLNYQIMQLKNQLYYNISSYLRSQWHSDSFPDTLFDNNGNLQHNYEVALDVFYSMIEKRIHDNKTQFYNEIKEDWKKAVQGEEYKLLKALNSYVDLTYFDNLLKDAMQGTVSINKDVDGFEVDASYPKYSFSQTYDHKRKGWETQEKDALSNTAKPSKIAISMIPMIDNQTGKKLNRNVTITSFSNTLTKLFDIIPTLVNQKTLQNYIYKFHGNPNYYSKKIFQYVATDSNNIKSALTRTDGTVEPLTEFDLNVLNSVYEYVYNDKNPNSINQIETAYLKQKFDVGKYSMVDSINGVIDRVMSVNYLQTQFVSNNAQISIKKKFFNSKTQRNIEYIINKRNANRSFSRRQQLLEKYPFENTKQGSTSDYRITINGVQYNIHSRGTNGILSFDKLTISYPQQFLRIFDAQSKDIDLTSQQEIDNLISNKNLNPDKRMFRDTLQFIQDMLGINLLSENGLNLLLIYKLNSKGNYIDEMFQTAVRASLVNQLYYGFEQAVNEKEYDDYQFLDYLKKAYYPFSKMKSKDLNSYLIQNYGVFDLRSIRVHETWKERWADAISIKSGESSRAITKDMHGNSIANYRTSFLGGNIQYYLSKYRDQEVLIESQNGSPLATNTLFFTHNNNFITNIVVSQDVQSRNGIKKNVKDLKASELFYNAIIFNFFGSYVQNGNISIQPTTYSDKTTFINYLIDTERKIKAQGKSYDGKTLMELNKDQVVDLYYDTIGKAYVNTFNNVIQDYAKIFGVSTVEEINEKLKQLPGKNVDEKEKALVGMAQKAGVSVQLDAHYRKTKSGLQFDELLRYYNDRMYTRDGIDRTLNIEKVNFVNDLLDSGVLFYAKYLNETSIDTSESPVATAIKNFMATNENQGTFLTDWVQDGKLVLAKVNGKPILSGSRIKSYRTFELNPMLEKYFYLDSLLANNLRLSLTGSEIGHPDKAKIDWNVEIKNVGLDDYEPFYNPDGSLNTDIVGDEAALGTYIRSLQGDETITADIIQKLNSLYNNVMRKTIASTQGTQLKRNVIIPGTLQYMQQQAINGIASKMKVAIIRDLKAPVFNFRGDVDEIDSQDGSAWVNAFASILENMSLQDQEAGVDKKPILHSFDSRTMTATLFKFATFTMTNERMRQSLGSDTSLYKLFKKMTDMKWQNPDGTWNTKNNVPIDLVNGKGFGRRKISFVENILKGDPLFYGDDGKHYSIFDLQRDKDSNVYYTVETEVDYKGTPYRSSDTVKVYHLFSDVDGSHKRVVADSLTDKDLQGYHTINSLYELHKALGGLSSESYSEDAKKLVYSEKSNYAVVNYMNNVSVRVGNDTSDLSQRTYYQPLKDLMISYAANNTAVKNGAANINQSSAWRDDSDLTYMEVDTDGLGIQMDPDHEIDEAEMTEFSQVISALEAGGRLHDLAVMVYNDLSKLAVQTSSIEMEALENYLNGIAKGDPEEMAKSDLYDIVVSTIVKNYSRERDKGNIALDVIDKVKNGLKTNDNHSQDELKLPLSDPNLYSNVLPTFISTINKKSIKRKFPGSGCVMVPAYGVIQNFKIGDNNYQFEDLLKLAIAENKTNHFYDRVPGSDIEKYNRDLVRHYLLNLQAKQKKVSWESFQPEDIAVITLQDDKGVLHDVPYRLESIQDYYTFTNPDRTVLEDAIIDRGLKDINGNVITSLRRNTLSYKQCVFLPKNLAPARVGFEYQYNDKGTTKTKFVSIYNVPEIRQSFVVNDLASRADKHKSEFYNPEDNRNIILQYLDYLERTNNIEYKKLERLYNFQELKNNNLFDLKISRNRIQKVFDNLENNIYVKDGTTYNVINVYNTPAEMVMSKLYASKFGLKQGDTLQDVLQQGSNYFAQNIKPIPRAFKYDITFTTGNGNNAYITFEDVQPFGDSHSAQKVDWDNTKIIDNKIYRTTKDNIILYQVGRCIDEPTITYNPQKKEFIQNGVVLDQYDDLIGEDSGKVKRKVEFISNYKVRVKQRNGKINSFYLYRINKEAVTQCLTKATDKDIDTFIGNKLKDIFNTSSYQTVQVAPNLSRKSAQEIVNTFPYFNTQNNDINNLIKSAGAMLSESLEANPDKDTITLDRKVYGGVIKSYYEKLANVKYQSFLSSQYFTAARIPAQTLQSFMQMKAVGFTQSSKNIVYVSHWQTWLQGSDY